MTSFTSNAFASMTPLQVQIRTGGYDVLAGGTVITADGKNLEFQIDNLRFVFSFLSDNGATRMEPGPVSSSALTLLLFNFNNSIGSGTTEPIEIGTVRGRKLLLSFMVYSMNPDSTKTVHYTFLLSDPK
jgi:hypothetical protein